MKPNKKQLLQFTLEEIIKFDIDNKAELMREILSEKLPEVLNVEAIKPEEKKIRYQNCLNCKNEHNIFTCLRCNFINDLFS